MRPAIIYNEQDIFVEFPPDKFKELLKSYMKKTKSIDKALDMIIFDLKQQTIHK